MARKKRQPVQGKLCSPQVLSDPQEPERNHARMFCWELGDGCTALVEIEGCGATLSTKQVRLLARHVELLALAHDVRSDLLATASFTGQPPIPKARPMRIRKRLTAHILSLRKGSAFGEGRSTFLVSEIIQAFPEERADTVRRTLTRIEHGGGIIELMEWGVYRVLDGAPIPITKRRTRLQGIAAEELIARYMDTDIEEESGQLSQAEHLPATAKQG